MKVRCHVIVTQQSPTVEQSEREREFIGTNI